jgi:hypothetical protein
MESTNIQGFERGEREKINYIYRLFISTTNYVDQYAKEKEVLERFAVSFRAFPSEVFPPPPLLLPLSIFPPLPNDLPQRAVDYRTHRGGSVRGSNGEEFTFSLSGGVVAFKGKRGATQLHFYASVCVNLLFCSLSFPLPFPSF